MSNEKANCYYHLNGNLTQAHYRLSSYTTHVQSTREGNIFSLFVSLQGGTPLSGSRSFWGDTQTLVYDPF